ncbi:PREDICTED: sorting nexin-30-like, partial [Priapulus caudatus]|uniref:Sorting nexin-30-like n=1 Tax=Priapulus caudatus TaxID=37621 RepID=A0ABM1F4P5_PRICU
MKRLEHFTIEFVRVRMFHLNQFLNRVAEHPVLSSDKSYQIFLTAKASEFASHKKTGYGFIHKVGDSLHGIAAGVMMKERPQEFVTVADYVATFTEKLGNVDRIAQRIQREQR